MNNKGFTLVEILAVVTIMGILSTLAITGYSRYINLSKKKAYDILAKSSAEAMEEYNMDHPGINTITFAELVEKEYLESAIDPGSKGNACKGKVTVSSTTNTNALDTKEYTVLMCCANYKMKYTYPGGNKEDYNGNC